MLSLRQDTKRYTARVINQSKELDISDYIDRIDISLPNSHEISSVIAKFKLTEKLIDDGNEVSIEVIDEVGNEIYSLLSGRAEAKNHEYGYIADEFNYEIKDSYNKLFNKVIADTEIHYDLFICNTKDEAHSLVHIIASKLGLKLDAVDNLTRVPFVLFKENDRWIDELQTLIEGTNSILYVKNKKLYFRSLTNEYDTNLEFNQKNIIKRVQEDCRPIANNGVRVQYDRYKKLDNQVVFNLASKVIVDENTTVDTDVPTMKIAYITSSVANAKITEAKGYYFTSDDPKTRKTIDLKEGIHYKLESLKDTGAEVKFYNPSKYKLYVESFEISGIPLAMYKDNESIVKASNVREKAQENFITVHKNKYIQTLESSQAVATQTYLTQIASNKDYSFYTDFIPNVEVGRIYRLCIRDIDVPVRVTSYDMILEPSNFMLNIKAKLVNTDVSLLKSNTDSLNPNREFIDLKPIHEKIADTDANLIKYNAQMKEALTRANDKLNKTIIEVKKELSQGIADNKIEIYSKKPEMKTLNDSNVGDLYIGNGNAEVLTKNNGKLEWKVISDKTVEQELNKYMQTTNNKLVTVSYQKTKPTKNNVGDLWINTDNDGVWYRWNGKEWEQVDSNVRNALKKANSDIKGLEKVLETVNNTVNNKIMAKAFIQEQEPKTGMKNYDIWYKQSTNEYKVYLNKSWNPAKEEDIFPSIRHYASLSNAQLDIGTRIGTVDNFAKNVDKKADGIDKKADKGNARAEEAYKRAGIFLSNNDNTFGSKNGTLAEVSLDKQGTIRLSNANNLLEWNVKDPKNPKRMRSKFYMGVTDTSKVDDDTYFKVGDEATGFSLELKEGKSIAKIEGKELATRLREDKTVLENKINNTNKSLIEKVNKQKSDTDKSIDSMKKEAIANATKYTDTKTVELKASFEKADKEISNKLEASRKEILDNAKKYTDEFKDSVTKQITFKVEGDANTYYPVLFQVDKRVLSTFTLYRKYYEEAPEDWNNKTHHGSLYLEIRTRFGSDWDGDDNSIQVTKFNETYSKIAGRIERNVYDGVFIWLRGGGAVYHAYTDKIQTNSTLKATVYLNGFAFKDLGGEYAKQYDSKVLKAGTYAEVGEAQTIKDLMHYNRRQIDENFKNADGKLTKLQSQYENTVKDVQNFKTETTSNLSTIDTALAEGNFTVTGNTVFDGTASFLSKGNGERIKISGGCIEFLRDINGHETKLTQIRNIRYGTVSTDSSGKGVVNFSGFRQPMLVFPTVKSANFGKNMASIFCYAEHLGGVQYRFFLGGTNEDVREAKPIKNVGTTWSANNVVATTLLGWTGDYSFSGKYTARRVSRDEFRRYSESHQPYGVITKPTIQVTIYRNSDVLFREVYPANVSYNWDSRRNAILNHSFSFNFGKSVNMFKKLPSRTNITYKMEIKILEANLKMRYGKTLSYSKKAPGSDNGSYTVTEYYLIDESIKAISASSFRNLSITASAETSTISSATGYGEVGYIAMEIE